MWPASNTVVGVDFGAPRRARDQRRKIIAIAAHPIADRRYRIDATGMNERLLAKDTPGWSASELLEELLTRPVRIVAFDFPFSIPDVLLRDETFAASAGHTHGAFVGWRTFNAFVAERLPLGDPLDFRPFGAWRARTDRAPVGQARHGHRGRRPAPAQGQVPGDVPDNAAWERGSLTPVGVPSVSDSAVPGRVRCWRGHRGLPGCDAASDGLAHYKSRPGEAISRGIAGCAVAGITLDVDPWLRALCCRYTVFFRQACVACVEPSPDGQRDAGAGVASAS